ncbi:MAG: hypothetical protein EA353_12420 [Puniceicoccaceae bacterium]|nr:MAG: hypothetical protein EA353_12420 [Puniceicoccaceae bacterium]
MINRLLATVNSNPAEQIGYYTGVVLAVAFMIGAPIVCIWSLFKFFKTKQKAFLVLLILSAIPTGAISVIIMMGMLQGLQVKSAYIDTDAPALSKSEVTIGDTPLRIALPDHWVALKELNPNATFQAGNLRQEEYSVVFAYHKMDLAATTDTLYYNSLNEFEVSLSHLRVIEERELHLLDRPARQAEISGTINDVNLIYLDTIFEGDDYYYRLLQWTLPSKSKQALPRFHDIIASIAEVGSD